MAAPASPELDQLVQVVRRFNRFYTRQIGVLNEGLLGSRFSLTEVRVLYELAHRDQPTAVELCKELGLDRGYVSRLLSNFEKQGLVRRKPSQGDGRRSLLALTRKGQQKFGELDTRSSAAAKVMLSKVAHQGARLREAMGTIEELLGGAAHEANRTPYLLRPHQPGDMGWVVHRHGVLYSQEYGYDEHFEALVAEIVAHFIQHFDPKRERCWIAEREGEIIGSVFLVKKSKTVAKLRLLLVEQKARGLGIGRRLVDECIRFARQAGYKKIILWTQSELQAARSIYEKAGFRLVNQKPHHSWGHDLVAEVWELNL
jgi:DNA-binding MarR family transcriptional regulator/N-acetylglutamate synthase-like GNAT family acetyltransferase